MSVNTKVLIIGAGASGYAAGCRFLENNFNDFKILEANNRFGGRVHSVKFGDGVVDRGAQWCHGEKGNLVYTLTKDLNLLQRTQTNYYLMQFVDSQGNFVDSTQAKSLMDLLNDIADDNNSLKATTVSFGDYISSRYWNAPVTKNVNRGIASGVLHVFEGIQNTLNGSATWDDVSSAGMTNFEESEGHQLLRWSRGYITIFSVLDKTIPDPSKKLPIDEKILFGKEVVKISLKEKGADVQCKDGTTYHADHVIVTLSLGVLKNKHETLFEPRLPATKRNAIQGLGYGTVNKIFLLFSEPWWPADCNGYAFIFTEEDKRTLRSEFPHGPSTSEGNSWLQNLLGVFPLDGHPRLMYCWLLGPLSSEAEKLSNDVLLDGISFLLQKYLGSKFSPPRPQTLLCTSWGSDPLFYGSYSYVSMESDKMKVSQADLVEPVSANTLLFAGEATSPTHYSTVHGAIETGFREADRILDLQKKSQKLTTTDKS